MQNTSILMNQKARIARQFSRAAPHYDSVADVQLDIAFDAMCYLPGHYSNLLDVGCGTGRITRQLYNRCDRLLAMDLAYGMLAYAEQHSASERMAINWLQGDADSLPIGSGSIDGLFSSMALQWCENKSNVISEIERVMAPGASAILAIMCDGSFHELNNSWLQIDSARHVNEFSAAEDWLKVAEESGLRVDMFTKQYVTWHRNTRLLLASIKSIGANVLLPTKGDSFANRGLNRHSLKDLDTFYQQKYAQNGQLPLTYQVCFLHCAKP